MSDKQQTAFTAKLELPTSTYRFGQAIAKTYYRHCGRGSITGMLRDLLEFDEILVPNPVALTPDDYARLADVLEVLSDRLQDNRQFQIWYRDGQGNPKQHLVRYAEPVIRERRYYLDVLVAEPAEDPEDPAIQHNRCLRLDRILQIGEALEAEQEDRLERLFVSMVFTGKLARVYEPRAREEFSYNEDGSLFVKRPVTSLFWLKREILSYGSDCIVLSPDSAREAIASEVRAMAEMYKRELCSLGE